MPPITFESYADADEAIRRRWGQNLTETMAVQGMTPKRLVIEMAATGVDVSTSSISQWCKGDVAPSPSKMAALARVLSVPPRMLFSLDIEIVKAVAA
ncbi:MAG TPA: helix-turn-helix transcriptional regulator [Rhodoglobus sp.]|jgi:transcriptional regulator with XRE-family HTH domain|nr:helix-turn-helix transcriptional regulator [Rhodoglobus sp.]